MANGRKTGGRNFKKGQGGRKKGAQDRVPRGLKAKITDSIRKLYVALLANQPDLFERCVIKDLQHAGAAGFHHVQLAAFYIDGKPTEHVQHSGPDGGPIAIDLVQAARSSLAKKLERVSSRVAAGARP